ncbi:Diaminopimelate decarboxylase [Nymphon striatum]|nr:Diaminopimelate decarboxylase [Nymphon striatum]
MAHINVTGIDCHIGSQLTDVSPFMDALERLIALANRLKEKGITIHHLDLGGGLGVRYKDENPPLPSDYTAQLFTNKQVKEYEILIEPGRAIAANAAVMLTPWQEIIPVVEDTKESNDTTKNYDIVGPICETGDFLGKDRELNLKQGDLLAVRSAGAYGFTMASNYNTRPRAVEILVDGDKTHVIRRRETIEELFANETIIE